MSGFVFRTDATNTDLDGVRNPITDADSRQLMLAGERHDTVVVQGVVDKLTEGKVPQELSIVQRATTYYGPKLRLRDDRGAEYLLTAPGPDQHLVMWSANVDDKGFKESWRKLAEVKATLSDDRTRYHLCSQCGEPLKTAEHERLAKLGSCPF